jgi:hypothetical protein
MKTVYLIKFSQFVTSANALPVLNCHAVEISESLLTFLYITELVKLSYGGKHEEK